MRKATAVVTVILGLGWAATADPVHAASVYVDEQDGLVHFVDSGSQLNDVVVRPLPHQPWTAVEVSDTAPLSAQGPGCQLVVPAAAGVRGSVVCTVDPPEIHPCPPQGCRLEDVQLPHCRVLPEPWCWLQPLPPWPHGAEFDYLGLVVDLGGGDDRFVVEEGLDGSRVGAGVRGGGGDDRISGSGSFAGGAGADRLTGSPYALLDGGAGADAFAGAGVVLYEEHTSGVSVTLDGLANDGQPGEGDNVPAVFGVIGTRHADAFTGSSGNDYFFSSGGADTFRGGSGDDVFLGGGGSDSVWGGPGADRIETWGGNDTVNAEDGPDSVDAGDGADTVRGGDGDDRLDGGDGADQLLAGAGNDQMFAWGWSGPDTFDGGAGVDLVTYIDDIGVAVRLDDLANDGRDWNGDGVSEERNNVRSTVEEVVGGAGPDRLIGSAYANRLDGGSGRDHLDGGGGNDVLLGGLHDDVLQGGSGNDAFLQRQDDSGHGADRLDGGTGLDTADYSQRTVPLAVDVDNVPDDGEATGEGDNVLTTVEILIGGSAADQLTATGPPSATVKGGDGDDSLTVRDGNADVADCGLGADVVRADAVDKLAGGCETVQR